MYNYGIIGFGGLGRVHLLNLVKIQEKRRDFQLKAICGVSPESFKENIRINLGQADISMIDFTEVRFYEDYKEMIEKEPLDFVLSVLPTYLHEEVAVSCLEKGIDIFSEKPMTLSVESCDNMIEAAKKNGAKLMIGQCLRFINPYVTLKEYIDNGRFGKVRRAEFTRYSETPMWTWQNWILDPEKSGGCALDMHIHDVDLINWYFGMPKAVQSFGTDFKVKGESIFTRYIYDDIVVTAAADWSMTAEFPFTSRCLINFEEATAVLEGDILTIYTDEDSVIPERSSKDYFVKEMEAFLKYVIDDKPTPITSPESVRESVRLVLCEIESAKTGKVIEV